MPTLVDFTGYSSETDPNIIQTSFIGFSSNPTEENVIKLIGDCGEINATSVMVKVMDLAEVVIIQGLSDQNGAFWFDFSEITGDYKIQVGNSVNIETFSYVSGIPINEDYLYLGRIYKVRALGDINSDFSNEVEV